MNVPVQESSRNGEMEIPSAGSAGTGNAETPRISAATGLAKGTSGTLADWPVLAMLVVLALGIGGDCSLADFVRATKGFRVCADHARRVDEKGKGRSRWWPRCGVVCRREPNIFHGGLSRCADYRRGVGNRWRDSPPCGSVFSAGAMDFSAVGSELLVGGTVDEASPMPLWAVPVPAGTAHRLGAIVAWDASWSPDGRDRVLPGARTLSGQKRWQQPDSWRCCRAWDGSHDGLPTACACASPSSTCRLQSHRSGSIARGNGPASAPARMERRRPRRCRASRRSDQPLLWQLDTGWQVFCLSDDKGGGRSDIWSMPGKPPILGRLFPSLAAPIRVTSGQLSSSAPVFSPDGRRLFVIGQQLRGELERYDNRNGEFLPWLGGISASFVDFSRDGEWVAYVAYPEGTLWRSRVDGSEQLQLTVTPMIAGVPKWSPDGSKILFYGIGGGKPQRVYIVPANGGAAQPASGGAGAEMQPNWSPDGASLMYSDFPFFSSGSGKVAIHLLNLATQKAEMLPGSLGFFVPGWSPNGRYVAALTSSGQRIMLFDFKTGKWSELVKGRACSVVTRQPVSLLPALRTGLRRHARSSGRQPCGGSGELEGNPPGRAVGGSGFQRDTAWCSADPARHRNAGDLFAGLAGMIINRRLQGRK